VEGAKVSDQRRQSHMLSAWFGGNDLPDVISEPIGVGGGVKRYLGAFLGARAMWSGKKLAVRGGVTSVAQGTQCSH
jgi:hypothetical protein